MEELLLIVEEDLSNMRLDQFIAQEVEHSRSYVQQLIKDGHVTVNGKVRKSNFIVSEGDSIKIIVKKPEEVAIVAEDIPLQILYEDAHMIVVDKARGMVVHPAAGNYSGTLVNALLYHCKDLSGINGEIRPGIVHRLDKDTSGVMMAAKDDKAHLGLAEQIKEHSAVRSYYALVHGNIVEERATIKAPIGRHPKERLKMAVVFQNSKEAITHFEVVERYGKYTLIRCKLETGRTHQIRVHMAYIDHPVVNDPLYGFRKMEFPIEGQALHSATLDVVHPITGKAMHFESPLPEDMKACIAYAKEHRK